MEDFKLKYEHLADKVRKMLAAQKAYFKSGKDVQLLKVAKQLEKEINEIVNPKPQQQGSLPFEYLAR